MCVCAELQPRSGAKRRHDEGPGVDVDGVGSRTRVRTSEGLALPPPLAPSSASETPIAPSTPPPAADALPLTTPRRSTRTGQLTEAQEPTLTAQEVLFRDTHWNGELDKVCLSASAKYPYSLADGSLRK